MLVRCLLTASSSANPQCRLPREVSLGKHPCRHHSGGLAPSTSFHKKSGFGISDPFSTPRHPSFAAAFGSITTTHMTPTRETQLRCSIQENAATRARSSLSNVCDAHSLDTVMEHTTQGTEPPSNYTGARVWLVGGPNSPVFDCNVDLVCTSIQHRASPLASGLTMHNWSSQQSLL